MIELAITVLACATVVYVAHVLKASIVPPPAPPKTAEPPAGEGIPIKRTAPPVPNDLLLQAGLWRDAWAREQALKNIQELYDVTQDWDRVRYIYSQQSIKDGEN